MSDVNSSLTKTKMYENQNEFELHVQKVVVNDIKNSNMKSPNINGSED